MPTPSPAPSPIPAANMPALPPGWVWTTVGEIADVTRKRADPQKHPELPFIGLEHIEAHTMRCLGSVPATEMRSNAESFTAGDVLYGRLRPYLNKVYRANFTGLCSAEFIVFRTVAHLDSKYLQYFLNAWDFVSFAAHLNEGDRPRVDFGQLAAYPFPLPPLAEQRRIVAAIETQLTRLDAGVASLKAAKAKLKRYRASVLKAACEGRLVAQDANDEPASVGNRQQGIGNRGRRASEMAEIRPRPVRWDTPEPSSGTRLIPCVPPDRSFQTASDTTGLPELPTGWVWATAEQICLVVASGSTPKPDLMHSGDGDIPFIKVYNLTFHGELDFSVKPTFVDRVTHEGLLSRSRTYPGDILTNIVGPPLGKVSLVPNQFSEWNINQAIAIFRPTDICDRHFLAYVLQSPDVKRRFELTSKATAGQFNLSISTCRNIPLPLPPLAEQRRIVAEVERLLSVVTALEATVTANLKRAERLRQSILKRAFEGKLVAQDEG
jgi:type I restriction enzyme, S subunit